MLRAFLTPPPPPHTHPWSLFYSHVSCRICFHTTLVLQSRRHSRYIYLYSFRTGGPKDSSGPGGEMSRHRARRRSPGRFNSQVRLAALATAADHPSLCISCTSSPGLCTLHSAAIPFCRLNPSHSGYFQLDALFSLSLISPAAFISDCN